MLAKQLRKLLPESGARVVREPTAARVASVMSTQPGDLVVIAYDIALEIYRGSPPFKAVNPIELRVLVENYKYQVAWRVPFIAPNWTRAEMRVLTDREILAAVLDRGHRHAVEQVGGEIVTASVTDVARCG